MSELRQATENGGMNVTGGGPLPYKPLDEVLA
jgi:hypothetical protein